MLEIQDGSQITRSTNIFNGEPMAFDHGQLAGSVPIGDSNNDLQLEIVAEIIYVCILPVSTDILTFTMNESSADILLA